MTDPAHSRLITFDTNMVGVWNTRAFWATLCEEIGQRMELVPTVRNEVLTRIRLETEREWTTRLRAINRSGEHQWSRVDVRDLAVTASQAARDWFRDTLRQQGSIYTSTPRPTNAIKELEAEIDATIDDRAFNLATGNGVRDRKIVIEAMARGYDILVSNNVNSIIEPILKDWIEHREGRTLEIQTAILRPLDAEEALRKRCGKPIEWTAIAAARACVTDPTNPHRAAQEIKELIDPFHQRGMLQIRETIYRITDNQAALGRILEHVYRHGTSGAMRSEAELNRAASQAVSRRAGVDISL